MLRITNLKLNLDSAIDYPSEIANLRKLVISKYKIKPNQLLILKLFKKAIDARKKDKIQFVYTIDIQLSNESNLLTKKYKNITIAPDLEYKDVKQGEKIILNQPVIIGFGPSGIFSALLLAKRGYLPIVLERGLDVASRTKKWNRFLETKEFDEYASILFGEGGAGTFSDGKLTTLINDIRSRFVLKELVKAGANPEIMHVNHPHIGTDILKKVVKNIREEIIKLGGIIRFNSKVTDFIIDNNKLKAIVINNKEIINTNICLLGIGHSARDTYQLLYDKGINITQKAFSVGVRIEHSQVSINKTQYGKFYNHPALGAADYKLSYHSPNGRTAYTFCMCPGGFVVNSSGEKNTVVTNGMSYSKRDGDISNSALLVNVTTNDFPSTHPLAGVEFQQKIERKAFDLAGKDYSAPIQLVGDFLKDQSSNKLKNIVPTYRPGTKFIELKKILPNFVIETLKEAIPYFNNKIKGFSVESAVLTAPETRSSSPIRINRNLDFEANIQGLYPMGEGAGFAGGIMSSAVDGIKTAEKIIEKYKIIKKYQ